MLAILEAVFQAISATFAVVQVALSTGNAAVATEAASITVAKSGFSLRVLSAYFEYHSKDFKTTFFHLSLISSGIDLYNEYNVG